MRRSTTMIFSALCLFAGCNKGDSAPQPPKESENKEPATKTAEAEPKQNEVTPPPKAPEVPTENVKHPLPGDPVAGEAVYKRACLACHGANGRGNGGITGADFIGDKTRLAKSNEELFKSISEGKLDGKVPMPPQKSILSEQEINDAIAYVRKTFGDQ